MACGRNFCPMCGEELIHRDHRQAFESASAFGQIVWREGPAYLTTGDIDHYAMVLNVNGGQKALLRIIEHKQTDQVLKQMQAKALALLARAIEALIEKSPDEIDPRSGVFVVRGSISAETSSPFRTFFEGPQQVSKFVNGQLVRLPALPDQESVFQWLEGSLGTKTAPGSRRKQQMPLPMIAPHCKPI